MELFGVVGLSNVEILTGAAIAVGGAATLSLALRAISGRGNSGDVEKRVGRLEVRMAAAQNYQPTFQLTDEILKGVSSHAEASLTSIVEASAAPRSWFAKAPEPAETANTLVSDLRDNIELATSIAQPIHNMLDNGAAEIVAQRAKLAAQTKTLAAHLGSRTWDKHKNAILGAGIPDTNTSLVIDCFSQIQNLKQAAASLGKKPSIDDLIEVLRRSAEVVTAAARSVDAFKGETAE